MGTFNRRKFLEAAGAGGAGAIATTVAAPAIAQSAPELRWRLTSSFPKSLDTIFGAAQVFSDALAAATDNRFKVQVFPGGQIAPPLKAADAVSNRTVEMCHTASYYYWRKDPTFAFGTAVPFGLNARMQNAWAYQGGGIELMNTFYAKYKLYALPAGNTGAQMGGWFRKEINTLGDLKDLKMRIAGLGGAVISKLGAVQVELPGDKIKAALDGEKIDAAEWVGPYDDEKLGFYGPAKFYYYPGWWEGGTMLHLFINSDKWNELPKHYKAAVTNAAALANTTMMAKYDVENPKALKRLVGTHGVKLRPFPEPVLDACFKEAHKIYDEHSKTNPDFKTVYKSIKDFRAEAYLWQQISENTYDTYMMIQQRNERL